MLDATLRLDPAWLRRRAAQVIRYAAVSIIANLTTITVLGVLVGLIDFPNGWANVIAVSVATIPSFELNRRWVWSKGGRSSVTREILPFWIWALIELGLSSLAVHFMGDHATAAGWSRSMRTLSAEITSIGTTGLLWIVQFMLFDRILFKQDKPVAASGNTASATSLSGTSVSGTSVPGSSASDLAELSD